MWQTNQNDSNLVLLGLQFLSSVACLVLLVNSKETLPHKEKEWHESLLHLYIVHKSGMLIYDHEFLKEAGKLDSNLVSGGIIGLGGVFCFDLLAQTIYVQYTFTFPLLLHILASFIGIMMFPVNFDFISEKYLPLFIQILLQLVIQD